MQSLSSFMNTIRFNFLYIDKYSFGRTWTYPESAIPYNMLRYIIDGSAEFVVDGGRDSRPALRYDEDVYKRQGLHRPEDPGLKTPA